MLFEHLPFKNFTSTFYIPYEPKESQGKKKKEKKKKKWVLEKSCLPANAQISRFFRGVKTLKMNRKKNKSTLDQYLPNFLLDRSGKSKIFII